MKVKAGDTKAAKLRRSGWRVLRKRKKNVNNEVRMKRNRIRKRRAKK